MQEVLPTFMIKLGWFRERTGSKAFVSMVGKRSFALHTASISEGQVDSKVLKPEERKPFVPPTLLIRMVRGRSWISEAKSMIGVRESSVASAMNVRILIRGNSRFSLDLTSFNFRGLRPWRMILKPRRESSSAKA